MGKLVSERPHSQQYPNCRGVHHLGPLHPKSGQARWLRDEYGTREMVARTASRTLKHTAVGLPM